MEIEELLHHLEIFYILVDELVGHLNLLSESLVLLYKILMWLYFTIEHYSTLEIGCSVSS